jgi:DNA-binding CsgD family transcriptional regulator
MAIGVHGEASKAGDERWLVLLRDVLPKVAASAGSAAFAACLVEALQQVLQFDWWMVMVYRQHAHPEMLCENFSGSWRAKGLTTYVGAFYVLDPFFLMSLTLDRPEVCRLGDITPDGFLDSEYHRAHYASGRIGDEVNYLWPLDPGISLAVSLERSESGPRFSDEEVRDMEAVQPMLYALARLHWAAAQSGLATAHEPELGRLVQEAAENFGRQVLTTRECEVVKLTLRGYSTKSISHALGISPGTVKVHRENIYSKLGVSSQAELFNMFIERISAMQPPRAQA